MDTSLTIPAQQQLAAQVFADFDTATGFASCPGAHLHSTKTGKEHFRLFFEEGKAPTCHCFHGSCTAEREEAMKTLYSLIRKAERGEAGTPPPPPRPQTYHVGAEGTPPQPRFAEGLAERYLRQRMEADRTARKILPHVNAEYLRRVSPVCISGTAADWPLQLLNGLYTQGERIILFDNMATQGQYLYEVGRGLYRLGDAPGQHAVKTDTLPARTLRGMWYLCAPVTGQWVPKADGKGQTRRSGACATCYRYAVIESDVVAAETWLPLLTLAKWPVAAIYTSGGKSIHALLRVDCPTHEDFRRVEKILKNAWVPFGADPAAITAMRLTRLPGVVRGEKEPTHGAEALQTLLYLDPQCTSHPAGVLPIYRRSLRR